MLGLVFELMDYNMYEWIKDRKQYIPEAKVKAHMLQFFKGLEHVHKNKIFHRDIKPENILINRETVKLADFGSCKNMNCVQPCTEYISTRWYRPPECLMTDGYYDYKMDIWGAGCVFFEMLSLYPLFQGSNELDQVHKIHDVIGTPDQDFLNEFQSKATHMKIDFPPKSGTGIHMLIPHVSQQCRDLISRMLSYKSDSRPSVSEILDDNYFSPNKEETHVNSVSSSCTNLNITEKCFTLLPPIKNSKNKTKQKHDPFARTVNLLEKTPYNVKKSILALKKAYAPDKKIYRSTLN